jgi:hypothetical protein
MHLVIRVYQGDSTKQVSMKVRHGISWNPEQNPETEDRIQFLRLSQQERWNHVMDVILLTYPKNKQVEYKKRIIEWN